MGSELRHRVALGPRCCYGAYVALGIAVATVTLVTMMFILWCYVGLVTFQLSENQRRAVVNYPFTTAKPQHQTLANSSSPNRTLSQDPREPYGAETASNNISKSPTVATMTAHDRGSGRVESSAVKLDKRKDPEESRTGDSAKGDFATRDRGASGAVNRTLAATLTDLNPAEKTATDDGETIQSSTRSRTVETQKGPSMDGSERSRADDDASRPDHMEDRIHARRVLSADSENRPLDARRTVGADRRNQDASAGASPKISPTRVEERDEVDRRTRKPADNRDYEDGGRPLSRNPSLSSAVDDDIPKSRRSDTEYSRDSARSSPRNDPDRVRPRYEDRETRDRYDDRRDMPRDIDERENYRKTDRRVYADEDLKPIDRDMTRDLPAPRKDDRYRDDDDRYRDRVRDDRYRDDRRRDDERISDDRYKSRESDDRRRDRDDRDRTKDFDAGESGTLRRRPDDDRYKSSDDRYRSQDDDRYKSSSGRPSDRKYDDDRDASREVYGKDDLNPRVRDRVREEEDRYRSSGESRYDDRDYRKISSDRDAVDRKTPAVRSGEDRRVDEYESDIRTERFRPRGEIISSRSDSSSRPMPPDDRYVDRDDYRKPSRDYETSDRISSTRTRDNTYSPKSDVDIRDDRRDYEMNRKEGARSNSREQDTPVLSRSYSSTGSEERYRDRDDEYRRPSRYDDDDRDRISPSRVRDESYIPRSTLSESRLRDDSRYDERKEIRVKDPRYDDDGQRELRIRDDRYVDDDRKDSRVKEDKYDDDDRYRDIRTDDSRSGSGRRPADDKILSSEPKSPDTKYVDREDVVLDRRSYSTADDEYRKSNRPSSRSGYDYPDDRPRDRRPSTDSRIDEGRYIRKGSDDDEYRSRPRGDSADDRRRYRGDEDKIPREYDRDDDRYIRKDDEPPRRYDRNPSDDDRPQRRDDTPRNREAPLVEPEDRASGSRTYPSYADTPPSNNRRYPEDRDLPRDRKEVPIPIRAESRRDRDPVLDSSMSPMSTREPSRVVIREKRFQSSHSKPSVISPSAIDSHERSSPSVEDKPRLTVKDVIEAAIRQPQTFSDAKEVFYPVFDAGVSNMTSHEVIKPRERKGSTINAKKRK